MKVRKIGVKMTIKECAYCSFDKFEHDRAMTLAHPLIRHAFVEKNATPNRVSLPNLADLARLGHDPHIVTPDAFEVFKAPANYRFTGLGQIYEGEDPKTSSSIGVLAALPFTDSKRLKDRREKREQMDEGRSPSEDPEYAGRYRKWQEAVTQHFKPISVIRSRKTSAVFEGYQTSDGRTVYVGVRPTDHSFSGSPVAEGEHVFRQHRSTEQRPIADPLTGTDLVVPQGQAVQGPEIPTIRLKGPGGVTEEKAKEIERTTIENWARSRGSSYEGYMADLASSHQSLSPHTHGLDLSQGDIYELMETQDGHTVLAKTSSPKSKTNPAPAMTFIHSVLRNANAIPESSSLTQQKPKSAPATPTPNTGDFSSLRADEMLRSRQRIEEDKAREDSYRALEAEQAAQKNKKPKQQNPIPPDAE